MLEIGWTKLVLIAVVALIAIGPKELPSVLRTAGHWMGKIRRLAAEFQSQFQEALREAEMEDLKKHADDLNNAARLLTEQPPESANRPASAQRDEAANSVTGVSETPPAAEEAAPADVGVDATSDQRPVTRV